jgi:hypothetical protein
VVFEQVKVEDPCRRACLRLNNQNIPGTVLFAGIQAVIAETENDDGLHRALYISNTNSKEHNDIMASNS